MNWNITGHHKIIDFLKMSVKGDKVSHAYLFSGHDGVGKFKTALSFAKALQCEDREEGNFCSECVHCRRIDDGADPDTIIFAGSDIISVEEIRNFIHNISLTPHSAPYKIGILENCDRMTREAGNAFLKTLEEPPGKAVIILTTSRQSKVLPTIISRCQIIKFYPVPVKEIKEYLLGKKILEKDAEALSGIVAGSIELAEKMMEDKGLVETRKEAVRQIVNLLGDSVDKKIDYASQVSKIWEDDPSRVHDLFNLWTLWFRDMLLVKSDCQDLVTNKPYLDILKKQGNNLDIRRITGILNSLKNAKDILHSQTSVNVKLLFENLFLQV